MRKSLALGFLVLLSGAGLARDARAGVTVDVVFQDAAVPSGITILPGDPGPGCAFGGWLGGSISTGYCMDVILTSTHPMVALSSSVAYDSHNGLAVAAMYEHKGFWAGDRLCYPPGGLIDTGSGIRSFDCIFGPPPANPPALASGTYRIGTIVWDTSGMTPGQTTVAALNDDEWDGVMAVINGNIVFLLSSDIVVGSHLISIIPEPGTAALLGLGLVGLTLAARRHCG